MPKLYLLGGENVFLRSAKEINRLAFRDAADAPAVLVFPWAKPGFDNTYRKRQLVTDYFRWLGAATVEFVEYGEAVDVETKIRDADLIYFTGGQASILLERAAKMHLEKPLLNFNGVIVGRSAGALALCRRCVTTQRYSGRIRLVNGLGLAPVTLKAHYIEEDDENLKVISQETPVYAVPKDSAIIYQDQKLSALGTIYCFNGGQRHIFSEGVL